MINMVKEYSGDRGFVSTAAGKQYLDMAYLQALSIKTSQSTENKYAVIVDELTRELIEPKHLQVFDTVVTMSGIWSFDREWEVRNLTPWKKTVKVDVDILFVNDIGLWWQTFENWKLLFTTTIENYQGSVITDRWHRRLFDHNKLPDVYTALYYFEDSVESAEFFQCCADVSENWNWFAKDFLIKNNNTAPRDDEIFSIAAQIHGIERCTLPGAAHPRFVHFKEPLNYLPPSKPWHEQLHVEFNDELWIGHYPQRLPIHYINESFVTEELIDYYEQNHRKSLGST